MKYIICLNIYFENPPDEECSALLIHVSLLSTFYRLTNLCRQHRPKNSNHLMEKCAEMILLYRRLNQNRPKLSRDKSHQFFHIPAGRQKDKAWL